MRSEAVAANSALHMFFKEFFVFLFCSQKGFTLVGHSLSLTFLPAGTRKSSELIFIFAFFCHTILVVVSVICFPGHVHDSEPSIAEIDLNRQRSSKQCHDWPDDVHNPHGLRMTNLLNDDHHGGGEAEKQGKIERKWSQ